MAIPKAMQEKYGAIEPLITAFCDEHLNEEYKAICLKLLEKLCRKRPSPLLGGKEKTWAAAIVYVIATNNFIFDKTNPHAMTAPQLAGGFGLAASTVGNKAAEIKRMFEISHFNPEWVVQEYIRKNPMMWMIVVDGLVVDARTMPLAIQKIAFENGFIPYMPGEGDEEEADPV